MITIPSSEKINSIISRVHNSEIFKSEPKIKVGVIGTGIFFIVHLPRLLKNEILELVGTIDVVCESQKLIKSFHDYDYKESNREKVIDRIYSHHLRSGYYNHKSHTDFINRSKKSVHKKQRARKQTIAAMKITGFPINEPEELNIFDMITE